MTGEAGADRRGLWIDDKRTGTKIRLGEVGHNIANLAAEQGHMAVAREALTKPRFGIFFSKEF